MSDEEQGLEMLRTKREIEDLTRQLAGLTSRKNGYIRKIEYMLGAMESYLSDDAGSDSVQEYPDFNGWPSPDDLRALFSGIHDTSDRLKKARHLLNQL